MIAPPLYKCEVMTLEKNKAIEKLEQAMDIIRAEIEKIKGGMFRTVAKPRVIGANNEKDVDDILAGIQDQKEGNSSDEDNEEGINIDLDEDGQIKEAAEVQEEEKKGKEEDDNA